MGGGPPAAPPLFPEPGRRHRGTGAGGLLAPRNRFVAARCTSHRGRGPTIAPAGQNGRRRAGSAGDLALGNPRVTLPEELHDLVRDVVADLRSAARGFGRDAAPSDHATPVAERRVVRQATILRLPEAEDPAPSTPPSTTQLEEAALRPRPEPELAPQEPFPWPGEQRQRAFLARLEVASAVPRGRQPARTRRVPVACRRASPLDAARTSRMLRVAIPAVPLAPATLTAAPSWVREVAATLAAPAHAAPQSLVATPVVRPAVAVPKLEPVPSPSTDPAAAPPRSGRREPPALARCGRPSGQPWDRRRAQLRGDVLRPGGGAGGDRPPPGAGGHREHAAEHTDPVAGGDRAHPGEPAPSRRYPGLSQSQQHQRDHRPPDHLAQPRPER